MFDTEKFISEVWARPPLYDIRSKDFANGEIKAKYWFEIGSAMFRDWNYCEVAEKFERVQVLMKKWKAISDSFAEEHRSIVTGKAASSKKRYLYYDKLQFLLPYPNYSPFPQTDLPPKTDDAKNSTQPEKPANNCPNLASTSANNTVTAKKGPIKRSLGNPNAVARKRPAPKKSVASPSKELKNILTEILKMQKEERDSDKNGHKAFLLSFVPTLDNMPQLESMRIRRKIAQVFDDHFRLQQEDRSRSSMSDFSMSE